MLFKSSVFWHKTPCSSLQINVLFGGIFRLRLQYRIKSWAKTSMKQVLSTRRCISEDRTLHNHRRIITFVFCWNHKGSHAVGSRYQTTAEYTADREDIVRAVVNCRVCELRTSLEWHIVTISKRSINPITNPKPRTKSLDLMTILWFSVQFHPLDGMLHMWTFWTSRFTTFRQHSFFRVHVILHPYGWR
jgi:hypothetical protein